MFFAITPITTVIFRYNNPDALLTLLMIGIAYATLEAIRNVKMQWLILAGGLVGAGFLTKQLQIALIVPAMGIAYIAFAHGSLVRRLMHLVLAAATAAVAGGWWFVVVQLTDPRVRPYVGGSMANNVAELTLGYNGLDRLSGQDSATSVTFGDWAPLDVMDTGLQRFLQPGFTGQFGWFLPLAVAGSIIAIAQLWRRSRPAGEAAFLAFSIIWLVVVLTVLAFMSGIVHPYYGLTAAPPMCSLAATCLKYFLRPTKLPWPSRGFFSLTLLATALMAYVSASRSTDDFPGLPQILLLLWALTISFHALPLPHKHLRKISSSVLIIALTLGPTIWSLNTVLTGHIGAGVSAGPSTLGIRADDPGRQRLSKNETPSFAALMLGDVPIQGVVDKIASFPLGITWPAAIIGSESAANYQLETGRPIMAVGGFNGTDQFPTLEQFKTLVSEKKIGALVIQNLPPVPAEGRGESARIVAWVRAHYSPSMIEGAELYELVN
ncbi:UNVERIFIED_ORG: 4-amino-4-deoxy-L-arabinose transferase-like glycosyltransferase [Arthrobacter sp. UYEF2]